MVKRSALLGLPVGLVAAGLWLSAGLGTAQIWLFGAGLLGLVGIALESCLEWPPSPEPRSHLQAFTVWITPSLLVVAGLWLMQVVPADSQVTVAVTLAVLMGGLLLGLQASLMHQGRYYRAGRFAANLILDLVVFLLFALVYHTKERSLITATAAGLIALLAALELFRSPEGKDRLDWRWAALTGLVVAETTWALNYWPVSGLVGGALLLLTFYVFSGLLLALREGNLDHHLVAEYGTVGIAGFVAIVWAAL